MRIKVVCVCCRPRRSMREIMLKETDSWADEARGHVGER